MLSADRAFIFIMWTKEFPLPIHLLRKLDLMSCVWDYFPLSFCMTFDSSYLQVGPDWYCMLVTYALIIVPTVLFIHNVAVLFGAYIIVPTVFLLFTTLG